MKSLSNIIIADKIFEDYKISKARHLLITGSINSGKSLILQHILRYYESYSYIYTYFSRESGVVQLKDSFANMEDLANYKNGKMHIKDDFFNRKGIDILNKHLNSSHKSFIIDEIGFLEADYSNYMKLLVNIFNKKKVLGVIRKRDSAINKYLFEIDSYYLVDIDEYYPKSKNIKKHNNITLRLEDYNL